VDEHCSSWTFRRDKDGGDDVGSLGGGGARWVVKSKKKLRDHNSDALCINCAVVFPPPSPFHYYPGLVGPTVHGQKTKRDVVVIKLVVIYLPYSLSLSGPHT
jgi:hypothetical protein